MDEENKSSMDNDEHFLDTQNTKQLNVPNCFEPVNRVKSDDGEVSNQMESYLIGELESVDLNETSNDCLERNSPSMSDSANTTISDSTTVNMTDSPTSIQSQIQASKKKK